VCLRVAFAGLTSLLVSVRCVLIVESYPWCLVGGKSRWRKELRDDQLLKKYPELLQRPVVVREKKAVLARPIERLAELEIKWAQTYYWPVLLVVRRSCVLYSTHCTWRT
jgi:hypothetical protein